MRIQLPQNVDYVIKQLLSNGYDAFAVGGCVRDTILGKEPEDWDITTSAKPSEVKKIFRRTIDTGIDHGTVTVMLDRIGYEVTTYRIDGEYEDNRHPKEVEFTSNLMEDLKRRDFTINAMAYNDERGMVDLFHGLDDINRGIIRAVGSATERFDEDALRILRAIRFSAQLGFQIEEETLQAVKEKAYHLIHISAERIRVELNKLLLSNHTDRLRIAYEVGITKIILPELDRCMETEQKNIHHIYSVGNHILKSIEEVGNHRARKAFYGKELLILRWTMLLHDIEKPSTKHSGKDGEDHFYKHAEESGITAKNILRRLKFDNDTTDQVVRLVRWHDNRFPLTSSDMRRAIHRIGEDIMELLFEVKRADILAQNPETWEGKLNHLGKAYELYLEIERKKECVSIRSLLVNGKDLIQIGYRPGKKIGEVLDLLLAEVLENPEKNQKELLTQRAKQILESEPR